jgi:hypothetical protein
MRFGGSILLMLSTLISSTVLRLSFFPFFLDFSLGAILLAKFTGPDWPVRGSSLDVTRDPVLLVSDKVRPPTRYDRLKGEKIRTKEVRERDKERGGWIQPFFVPHLPFYFILSCF